MFGSLPAETRLNRLPVPILVRAHCPSGSNLKRPCSLRTSSAPSATGRGVEKSSASGDARPRGGPCGENFLAAQNLAALVGCRPSSARPSCHPLFEAVHWSGQLPI
jgi:hypothetical protein